LMLYDQANKRIR